MSIGSVTTSNPAGTTQPTPSPLPASLTGSGATGSSSTSGSAGAPGLAGTQDEFLRLLVEQLKAQDPLDPQKSSDFVAQLAQFSQLEQTTQTNTMLSQIATGQASLSQASMTGLVGKTVTARSSTVTLGPQAVATPAPLLVHLDGAAAKVQVTITDGTGKTVRTLNLGALGAGDSGAGWNGTDDQGRLLPPGTYNVAVQATDSAGHTLSASSEVRGVVGQVEFRGGNINLHIGAQTVAPGDIVSIGS